MDSALSRLIFLGVTIAASAAVIGVLWTTLGDNTTTDAVDTTKYANIDNKDLCETAGGTWTDGGTPPCAKSA